MGDPTSRHLFIVVAIWPMLPPHCFLHSKILKPEVMGNMLVILHHSAVTEKCQLGAARDRTWDHRLERAAR